MNPKDALLVGKLSDNLMLSGGAKGADCYWAQSASKAGHQVIHWSFKGHKSHDPDNTVILDDEILNEADIHLEEARLSMKRNIPYYKPWIANLLRRNWFQVQYAQSVYAVGTLNEKAIFCNEDPQRPVGTKRTDRMGVNGGTAWALMMADDNNLKNICFFNQNENRWLSWDPIRKFWVYEPSPATPSGIWAGIGTRDLSDAGRDAIDLLF